MAVGPGEIFGDSQAQYARSVTYRQSVAPVRAFAKLLQGVTIDS